MSCNFNYSRRLLLPTPVYQTQPPTPSHDASSSHAGFNANIVMILSVLLCALICSLCVNFLIKYMLKCTSLLGRDPNYDINTTRQLGVTRDGGVERRVLRSFPIVKFSKEVNIKGLDTECVICLSEFQENEKLRILPKCNHGFHVKCIDKWFKSHTSCPTCRHSLVDTCQKIIGCHDNHNQDPSSSSTSSTVVITGEMISLVSIIVPLERQGMVRSHRG